MRSFASLLISVAVVSLFSQATRAGLQSGTEHPGNKLPKPATFTVSLRDEAPYFNPKRLRIPRGSTVIWDNRGPALVHTIFVSTVAGGVRSGSIRPGQTFSHTFENNDDAVIKAACEVHPYMYGIVIVGDPPESMISAIETTMEPNKGSNAAVRILEFQLPVPNSVPSILAIDAEDNVWFTMGGGGLANIDLPALNMVGKLTLDGDIMVYSLPTKASAPDGLAIGPDGAVYVTQYLGGRIARIDPKRRSIEEYIVPTASPQLTGLAVDANGNLWFNENKGNKVGRLSPSGVISEYQIPSANSRPTGMVIDHQANIWFSERDTSKVGCLRADGTIIEYSIPTPNAKPTAMAVDSLGRVWFSERQGNKIAVVEEGLIREYPLPNPNSGAFFLLIDGDDHVWFSELFGNRIGVLDPKTGKISEYDLPTKDSWPGGLAMDSQGNLWFSMQLRNKIGVLLRSPSGELVKRDTAIDKR